MRSEPRRGAKTPSSSCSSKSRSTGKRRLGVGFSLGFEVLEARPGYAALRARGHDIDRFAAHEAGGHRWQRVPPTEKRGRVHTSTITVAVLDGTGAEAPRVDPADVDVRTTGSSGAGGQHVNKRDSAVVMTHRPTGLRVRIEGRSQTRNRELAMQVLEQRLRDRDRARRDDARNAQRKSHVGSGMRGDKRRTIAVQRDSAIDHRTGRETSVQRYRRGFLHELWPPER